MHTLFEASFEKDLKKLNDNAILQDVRQRILEIKRASDIREIRQIKKLKGYETFYRIRIGNYRLGIEVTREEVIFTRFLHRKDIYRYFPK